MTQQEELSLEARSHNGPDSNEMRPEEDPTLYWNKVAMAALKFDYTDAAGPQRPGPTATSRAQAIIHLAMFDAFAGITGGATYLPRDALASSFALLDGQVFPPGSDEARAAIAAAADTAITALYSNFASSLLPPRRAIFINRLAKTPTVARATLWGASVARAIIAARANDGSDATDAGYVPREHPRAHKPDPLNPKQGLLGTKWGDVAPFAFVDTATLRSKVKPLANPMALSSHGGDKDARGESYKASFAEVLRKGAMERHDRTTDEEQIGLFWAYDGVPQIGVPIRLYNQIARAALLTLYPTQENLDPLLSSKLFAMVNLAMADCGVQAWHEKYKWNFWRPVVGVRSGGDGFAPMPTWNPFGAPKTNTPDGGRFTPPFPAYPSGHATFGTAVMRVIERVLNINSSFEIAFISDELNGVSFDVVEGQKVTRPLAPRIFTINKAIQENLESRVFLGVHWRIDGDGGALIGEQIAKLVTDTFPRKVAA